MACEFTITRRVEFFETDMAGILHFSNYFRYMEAVEHAFFRSLGHSVAAPPKRGGTAVGWPRVHAECDFRRPLRFEDEVELQLLVAQVRRKTIAYQILFHKVEAGERVEVARGRLVVAAVVRQKDGTLKAVQLPEEVRRQLHTAPRERLRSPGPRSKPGRR